MLRAGSSSLLSGRPDTFTVAIINLLNYFEGPRKLVEETIKAEVDP